jgi:hypothetical protein
MWSRNDDVALAKETVWSGRHRGQRHRKGVEAAQGLKVVIHDEGGCGHEYSRETGRLQARLGDHLDSVINLQTNKHKKKQRDCSSTA